jgi:hypothetical protein
MWKIKTLSWIFSKTWIIWNYFKIIFVKKIVKNRFNERKSYARFRSFRSLPNAEEYLFYVRDELPRRSSLSARFFPTRHFFLLLFLFPSGRSRTSRLSLLHLFIGPLYYLQFGAHSREGNFILVFCPRCPPSPKPTLLHLLYSSVFASSSSSSSSSIVSLPF